MNISQFTLRYTPKTTISEICLGKNLILPKELSDAVVIHDEKIVPPQGAKLYIKVSGGEGIKNRQVKEQIENFLVDNRCGSDTLLVAIGGGALLDLAGFVAATYCRGIRLWFIPTTLLAMVDASIGGKNGINLPHRKNYSGTIYQPEKIFIDVAYLSSLTTFDLQNGIVEMVKHAILDGTTIDIKGILARDEQAIYEGIASSVRIKTGIIEASCNTSSIRDLLNFGHTIGHALEELERFTITHGQAVAVGLKIECTLGALQPKKIQDIQNMLNSIGLPYPHSQHSESDWRIALGHDKKAIKGHPRFVLFDEEGHPKVINNQYSHEVDEAQLFSTLKAFGCICPQ
jgi:3-dehydroquinate synthase